MRLSWAASRMHGLYGGHPDWDGRAHARQRLVHEALECHREARFATAIPVVLAQLDGVVLDLTSDRPKTFFSRKGLPKHLVDDVTLAGHPAGIQTLSQLMTPTVKQTTLTATTTLRRNGVMHGRDLAYDSKLFSTQAFVALLATLEWATPIAREQADQALSAHRARWQGSRERDERGRLHDTRGFEEAKRLLGYMRGQQHRRFDETGAYAASQTELDPHDAIFEGVRVEVAVSEDRGTYWSWTASTTGYVFGVAGRDGDWSGWEFADWSPPNAGPDDEPRWRSLAADEPHPDW